MIFIFHKSGKEKAHRQTGNKKSPIVQPLAPCRFGGCCVVIGAVPRTLFMVIPVYQNY